MSSTVFEGPSFFHSEVLEKTCSVVVNTSIEQFVSTLVFMSVSGSEFVSSLTSHAPS